ncbi:MAG TPA: HPr family phosphocarrier protein [Verrucomicrobiota bacterium]|nr:HPr family phosphocarrier protein [Verrucomicrobiota bacterium]
MSAPTANSNQRLTVSREVTVTNRLGVHARPSSQFVKLAGSFACDVFIEKDGETINGKSIMGLLMLAAGPGSLLTITCTGEGATDALEQLVSLIENKFGES